jgi:hypothetical protein
MDKTGRRDGLRSCTHVLLVADCNIWEQGVLLGVMLAFSDKQASFIDLRNVALKQRGHWSTLLDMHRGVILQLMNIVAGVL